MKKILLITSMFACSLGANAQNWNGDMNSWRSFSAGIFPATQLEAPNNWYSADSLLFSFSIILGNVERQLFKEASAHSGPYAAKLVTEDHGGQLGIVPAIMSNAKINFDIGSYDPNNPLAAISYEGGTPVSQRIQSINAWIKYLPTGSDAGSISVQAVLTGQGAGGTDSTVGAGTLAISQAYTDYTYVEVPLTYVDPNVVPDKLFVLFTSSTNAAEDNTTMYIDDVYASLFTAGVELPLMKQQAVVCYPNPSKGIVSLSTDVKEKLQWIAYDIKGQEINRTHFIGKASVDMSALADGTYFYHILNTGGETLQRGKITIGK